MFCFPRHPIIFFECERPRVVSVYRETSKGQKTIMDPILDRFRPRLVP
jgi:hypothetical protein